MVLTPKHRPVDLNGPLSPLLLPIPQTSPRLVGQLRTGPPALRTRSTGSFSKLSDFRLDDFSQDDSSSSSGYHEEIAGEAETYVDLSIDAG
jgi:hypothetical protein